MVFLGAKFCSHCGARVDRQEQPDAPARLCPRCRVDMKAVLIGTLHLRECPGCEGLWVDTATLQQIRADRENQAAVLGMAAPVPPNESVDIERNIRYLPCPVCRKLMNRVNFAHCSHVVVDVCSQHGTWFDKDELRRIVEFIRGGGLEREREREIAEIEEQRHRLREAQRTGSDWEQSDWPGAWTHHRHAGLAAAASMLGSLFD
jgi:Zn-finger nucleic acid-binding protein